ncbi:Transposase, Mutator family [Nitrosomonas sp. Nm51]|nr:Transposase, Mutator family [Nitrosomonas sp. Nm51]
MTRRSIDRVPKKAAIHMVSAWAQRNSLVLGQAQVGEKSNEITAIPKLLSRLDLTGTVIAIDAMGCQKKITSQIVRQDADYILSLKGNQTKKAAESALDTLEAKWGKQYPTMIESWRSKWDNSSVFFKYPEPIRRIMYTTNANEAVPRQFRKSTKIKDVFPNKISLLKLLYVGIKNASRK